jgi:soluble lytic murein transglycosylase
MQFRTILTSIGVLAALCHFPPAAAATTKPSPTDDVIVRMSEAFGKNNAKLLSELLPRAQGHVLTPWAAYWELRARLERASADEVTAFFKRYAGTYQEDRLRNDWLLLLGQRRDWSRYVLEAPNFRMNDDREVRCYTLAMEHSLTGVDMATEVKAQWLAQREADDGCLLAARLHHASGKLSDAVVWRKVRLALQARRNSAAHRALDIVAAQQGATLTELIARPERFLLQRTPGNTALTQELVLLALIQLANSDADRAAQLLQEHWQTQLSIEQLGWAWGSIGMQAAQQLSTRALPYFVQGSASAMNDEQLAWRARAALRQLNWREVHTAVQAMSEAQASQAIWVYWRARAMHTLASSEADKTQALQLWQSIASVRGFYEMLALEALGLAIAPPPQPEALTDSEKAAARNNPGLQRALAAIALGLRTEGVREWNYHTNLHAPGGMNDRELYAAADLACQHEVWDRCINTSERTRTFIDLAQRFPMPHRQAVLERSRAIGLDPAYVYGLIRQESRFITDARSGVGASGLMQVMPKTAKWTAQKIGMTGFKPQLLNDRDINIAIGTGYLKLVLDDFAGSMPLAAAAYNAGPSRPRNWRGQAGAPVLEAAIWAENVPFAETRDYVKKVLANTTIYAAMISGQTQSLKTRLGSIGPRTTSAPAPDTDLP